MYKLLIVGVQNEGVGKFRFLDPHIHLQKNYPETFNIKIVQKFPNDLEEYLEYDAIFLQGTALINDMLVFNIIEPLKKQGVKILVDFDDYWIPSKNSPLFNKMVSLKGKIESRLHLADLVCTTTKTLAKKIHVFNKNISILPNSVNTNEEQFKSKHIESNMTRILWAGGSSHYHDLKLLDGVSNKLKQIADTQMIMCGFNNLSRNPNTGEKTKLDFPKTWMMCETFFSNNYNLKDLGYKKYLLNPQKTKYVGEENMEYRRFWSRKANDYVNVYNHCDIALAPLVYNDFNKCKSQLKILEAGFHKKPIIVSDIDCYSDCVDGKNALIVPKGKDKKWWFKNIKKLINNPSMREDLGESLYETVVSKYTLDIVNSKRKNVYLNVLNKIKEL